MAPLKIKLGLLGGKRKKGGSVSGSSPSTRHPGVEGDVGPGVRVGSWNGEREPEAQGGEWDEAGLPDRHGAMGSMSCRVMRALNQRLRSQIWTAGASTAPQAGLTALSAPKSSREGGQEGRRGKVGSASCV